MVNRKGDDEEGEFGSGGGSAGDFGAVGKIAGGESTAGGKDECATGGVSLERFVSRGDGRSGAVGEADVDRQAGEVGGVGLTTDVDARHADDAGSGSDETGNEAGGGCGGWGRGSAGGGA